MSDAKDLLEVGPRIHPSAANLRMVFLEEWKAVAIARAGHDSVAVRKLGAVIEDHLVLKQLEAVSTRKTKATSQIISTKLPRADLWSSAPLRTMAVTNPSFLQPNFEKADVFWDIFSSAILRRT